MKELSKNHVFQTIMCTVRNVEEKTLFWQFLVVVEITAVPSIVVKFDISMSLTKKCFFHIAIAIKGEFYYFWYDSCCLIVGCDFKFLIVTNNSNR